MAENIEFRKILKSVLTGLLGCALCASLITFVILSIPVYVFRFLLIHRPKSWRPDLDEILDVTSSAFVNDYFTGKPTRANVVLTIYVQGKLTTEEVKAVVLRQWINAREPETGDLQFKRFQQYPVRWLGFTFWKNGNKNFSVENHVYKLFGPETCVTDNEIDIELEKLLIHQFPKEQSPWSFHVIENYKNAKSSGKDENQSVIIFTEHHCLSDGFGLMTAFIGSLIPQTVSNKIGTEKDVPVKSFQEKFWDVATFSSKLLKDVAKFLPHQLGGAPWLIPDRRKAWRLVVARPEPIHLHDFKQIKTKFGGSFTSILVSAVSAATYKTMQKSGSNTNVKSMLCLSTLQGSGVSKMKTLSNQVAGNLFDVPTTKMLGPVQRLRKVNQMVETSKESMMPVAMQFFAVIFGSHFYPVCEALVKNRSVPIGLSNIPVPIPFKYNGKPVTRNETMAGGLQGDSGITIVAQSYGNEVRFSLSAEEGLMSREDLEQFGNFFTQEIHALRDLTQNGN